jgi:hypothetical protein
MYRYQHIYLPILYGVLGLKFRIQDVTDTFMLYVRADRVECSAVDM